ncbi:macro domain-containing protein [Aeromonas eucrenophila]|uniref:Macro domain-containing protein n=1 Tax=Aeromonas eucrenophila TaxID=649 RepID=A0ABW0Y8H0_9GAMM|nr:macro domain-containing protein [Aeromonas eucrenophila]
MSKVNFFDRKIKEEFYKYASGITAFIAAVVLFWDIPAKIKTPSGLVCIATLLVVYIVIWIKANKLQSIDLSVEGSTVTIKVGDIFSEDGLKIIAFNEYFDTQVDDKIIAHRSLNGIFITQHMSCSVAQIDDHISQYHFDQDDIGELNEGRLSGKKQKYELGTLCVYEDYLLTAFSKFNKHNEARLTMPEYLGFLINFWDRVNRVYAQRSISVPIFGSGITRIKEHRDITDEDLLKIMLWTFRISETRFNYPAKLTIVIHKDKIDKINLFDLQSARNGL